MKRETVMQVLDLVKVMREGADELRRIVDAEALQVGDRNVIDHSVATISSEVEVLRQTLSDMLVDHTKSL